MRVQTLNNDENIPWVQYIMPASEDNSTKPIQNAVNDSELKPTHTNRTVLAPVHLEALPSSPRSIILTWKDPRIPVEKLAGFYMICYAEIKSQQNCENGSNYIKR